MYCKDVEYSNHSVFKLIEREISVDDVEAILETGEVIKEYLNDKPYPSFLILGFIKGKPIHIVTAYYKKTCIIITAYWVDKTKWDDNYKNKI